GKCGISDYRRHLPPRSAARIKCIQLVLYKLNTRFLRVIPKTACYPLCANSEYRSWHTVLSAVAFSAHAFAVSRISPRTTGVERIHVSRENSSNGISPLRIASRSWLAKKELLPRNSLWPGCSPNATTLS